MEDYLKRDFYENASNDSMTWLENADFLKLSGDLIHENIITTYEDYKRELKRDIQIDLVNGVIHRRRDELDVLEAKLKSFSNTYYLLIGYSFENLIKGLSIKNNPGLSFDELFSKKWKKLKSGHGFSDIYAEIIKDVLIVDYKLLERLETYIIWLGRYPVAKNSNTHIAEYDMRYFDSEDKIRIDNLYAKIKEMFNEEKNYGC